MTKFSRMADLKEMEPVLIRFHEIKIPPPSNWDIDFWLSASPFVGAESAEERAALWAPEPALLPA